ncbi:MAG TPA: hypothetical protein VIE65_13065 [Methylobacter sp.]|jgi:hypothetical protein
MTLVQILGIAVMIAMAAAVFSIPGDFFISYKDWVDARFGKSVSMAFGFMLMIGAPLILLDLEKPEQVTIYGHLGMALVAIAAFAFISSNIYFWFYHFKNKPK